MSNDNYRPLIAMGADGFYTAAQAGPFNEFANIVDDNPRLTFAAFVAFIIDPAMQQGSIDEASPPTEQWLWGNFDTTPKTGRGWSFTLVASVAGQLQLQARVATAGGTINIALADLAGPNLANPFGNVIFATLWYSSSTEGPDNSNLVLGINGSLAAYGFLDTDAGYLASPYAARLGADPVNGAGVINSNNVEFISCGFAPVPLTMAGIGIDAEFIGSSWRGFYEAWGNSSYLLQAHGYDWKHRYDALSVTPGLAGAVTKTASGAYLPLTGTFNDNYPRPPAQIPDNGNQSPNPLFKVSPFIAVPLNRSDGATERLLGTKNTPFYQPQAFVFPTLP